MEFNLSDEQKALIDMARTFSAKEIAPFAAEWDTVHRMLRGGDSFTSSDVVGFPDRNLNWLI